MSEIQTDSMWQQTLVWPFFEARHRALAALADAIDGQLGELIAEEHQGGDVNALAPKMVAALGRHGWLNHAASLDGQLDARSLCLIRDMLCRRSGLAEFCFALQGLGSAPVSLHGSVQQRERWLPGVIAGEIRPAFALSETGAGSNPAEISTQARRCAGGWVIDGAKTWISNAGIADLYLVFARTSPPEAPCRLSCFIVEASNPGLQVTERLATMAPHPLGSLALRGCQVTDDALIGDEGAGFKVALSVLDVFRSSVGASAVGMARRALDHTLKRVAERQIGGLALSSYQMTRDRLADMATLTDAAALLVYRAAWLKDTHGVRTSREAAMAKFFATEQAQKVIDMGLQLFGGLGVLVGMPLELLYREIRALRIYEGTTEIQKLIIAGQLLDH